MDKFSSTLFVRLTFKIVMAFFSLFLFFVLLLFVLILQEGYYQLSLHHIYVEYVNENFLFMVRAGGDKGLLSVV